MNIDSTWSSYTSFIKNEEFSGADSFTNWAKQAFEDPFNLQVDTSALASRSIQRKKPLSDLDQKIAILAGTAHVDEPVVSQTPFQKKMQRLIDKHEWSREQAYENLMVITHHNDDIELLNRKLFELYFSDNRQDNTTLCSSNGASKSKGSNPTLA